MPAKVAPDVSQPKFSGRTQSSPSQPTCLRRSAMKACLMSRSARRRASRSATSCGSFSGGGDGLGAALMVGFRLSAVAASLQLAMSRLGKLQTCPRHSRSLALGNPRCRVTAAGVALGELQIVGVDGADAFELL